MTREGFEIVQRNWRILLLYLSIGVALQGAHLATDSLLLSKEWIDANPDLFNLYFLGVQIVVAAVTAFARCIAFARLGAEIDKPYWKTTGDKDALKRFFTLWFILNLGYLSSFDLVARIGAREPESALTLLAVWILATGLLVPFGASIMFYGRVAREELVKAIETLLHQLPRLLTVLLFAWAVSCFVQAVLGQLPVWGMPLLVIISGYTDCVVFSTTWLVCMVHRDEEPEDEDFDF